MAPTSMAMGTAHHRNAGSYVNGTRSDSATGGYRTSP